MADEAQLEILLSGVDRWNHWREQNPLTTVNLRRANLRDADLRGVDLRGAGLREANLRSVDLRDANLQHAYLLNASLLHARLQGADLLRANLQDASLWFADLRETHLEFATLQDANLRDVNLQFASLRGVDLRSADLQGAKLRGADVEGAKFQSTVIAAVTCLAQAKGLEFCRHFGPSAVDQRTLEAAGGQLPEDFLKGCGLKDWEIENAKLHDSQLNQEEIINITYRVADLRGISPIEVRPLFISYSHIDTGFVDFLGKRLNCDGIRYWRDTEEMKAGPVKEQIDAAISLNKTVLLVLSKNSIDSDWVEWEVNKARELQKRLRDEARRVNGQQNGVPKNSGKTVHVLCPIAIDDSWKDLEWSGPLMNQIKKYNILDFSSWQEDGSEDAYQKLKRGIAKYYGDS